MGIFKSDAFAGKSVFVAGGSSGINLGIAEAFAAAGANVGVISRNAERIAAAVSHLQQFGGDVFGASADVRDYDQVADALATAAGRFGGFDVVVSGAAGNFLAPALGLSSNAFRTVVEIDLIGTFHVFRASYEHLRRPGASLIAITSSHARQPVMFQAHVCAAKAGVDLLTKTLAMEWGPSGVRVNGIAPGPTAGTEGMRRLTSTPDAEAAYKERLSLRRYAEIGEIADAALFLASENAAYVNGTILDCDGGSILGDASGDALTIPDRN